MLKVMIKVFCNLSNKKKIGALIILKCRGVEEEISRREGKKA